MLIQDIMTRTPITVRSSSSIAQAAKALLDNHISGLPVVDDNSAIVGIVSEGDFLRRGELDTERQRSAFLEFFVSPGRLADEYVHAHGRLVGEVMTSPAKTISPRALVSDAVEMMERDGINRLPVVDGEKLVGIVTRSDLLRALADILADKAKPYSDAEIEALIIAELGKRSWSQNGFIHVNVKDGTAELSGSIFDERERLAAKVLAENIPGVKAVKDCLTWIDPYIGVAMSMP
ncbi:CBS domain-containing protein [Rhizobium sp. P28RR-XV]|uniref:CBS domain-containing protein n=1 Tax=Rhizobium sp. P28RR-XV TaxID=2726737 RepID=UPI0014572DAB|nr:CBS domain-containing protein [Rhizobium sp. P28RR-XV]NLR86131.1 CBS domain-containing protein [Rhizobium sp. P28RR-XV]